MWLMRCILRAPLGFLSLFEWCCDFGVTFAIIVLIHLLFSNPLLKLMLYASISTGTLFISDYLGSLCFFFCRLHLMGWGLSIFDD